MYQLSISLCTQKKKNFKLNQVLLIFSGMIIKQKTVQRAPNAKFEGCFRANSSDQPAGWEFPQMVVIRVVHHEMVTPPKANMTMKKTKHLKVYHLLKIMILHRHVTFWGCTKILFISNSFDCLRH